MPRCGDDQLDVAADLVAELSLWRRSRDDFRVGSNEAGMKLGDEVRAADAAVWRREDLRPRTGGLRRVAPVLAAEVAGRDDTVEMLRGKARWYLDHGVQVGAHSQDSNGVGPDQGRRDRARPCRHHRRAPDAAWTGSRRGGSVSAARLKRGHVHGSRCQSPESPSSSRSRLTS